MKNVYCCKVSEGLYKIGFARNLRERFAALRKRHPDLEPLHAVASERHVWLEKYLHAAFADRHIGGEIFMLESADVANLRGIPARVDSEADLPAALIARHLFRELHTRLPNGHAAAPEIADRLGELLRSA